MFQCWRFVGTQHVRDVTKLSHLSVLTSVVCPDQRLNMTGVAWASQVNVAKILS